MPPTANPVQRLAHAITAGPSAARSWRVLLVLLLCTITWLALTPVPPQQASLGWDKLNHAAAFAILAAVAFLGRIGGWVRIAWALVAYGALIEILQSFTPTRSAEWGDLLADGAGIASGLLLAAGVSWLASRPDGKHR